MQEQKSFWKKYEFLIIAIITLVFIYIIVFFNQKINFLMGNELIVSLNPQDKSFSMHYGDISKVQFDVSIDNVAYCKAACSYSFNDRSRNEVIDKDDFEIENKQQFTKSYELSVKRLGSGQDIYSFDVRCHSMRSFLCLTKSNDKSRSSLVIVNYDLTETEKKLKEILKQNVTRLLELLSDVDALHQRINQKYFEMGFKVNLLNLSREKINIDDTYDKTRISIENLRSLWSVEDYIKLNQLFNESFFETLYSVRDSIGNLDISIESTVALHNELLSGLNKLSVNLKQLNSFVYLIKNGDLSGKTDEIAKKFNALASSLNNNTFDVYGNILKEIAEIVEQQNPVIEKSRMNATSLFFESEYSSKLENDLLCSLEQSCSENASAENAINETQIFIENYPDLGLLRQSCDSLNWLAQRYSETRNETSVAIAGKNISFPTDNEFLTLADNFNGNQIRSINNSYYHSFEKIKSENKTNADVIGIADSLLPKNEASGMALSYNQSLNISLYLLSKIKLSDKTLQLLDKCSHLNDPTGKIGKFNFEPIIPNITYKIISRMETNLSDNPPICCVFNDCKPCCRDNSCSNDPKTFPVIFLHGHSFAKDNSPEFSLDSFNNIQSKLQEDGYLNAGIVSLYSQNEQVQKGSWGLSGKPVTVKASYYYDAFRKEDKYIVIPTKSENIDTYALRLKDLIGIVKERTNKPKVNIIAHSMGGLVARRYIQIFGEDDVDKLIMVVAPNKGISGQIGDYCGLIGENRECTDMQENSLFLNKLNDPSKQPDKVGLYAIVGQGCKMKFGDGDGIVLSENTKLQNAKLFYVNGTCDGLFGGLLHTEILNIEKYPETYNIVKGILKE